MTRQEYERLQDSLTNVQNSVSLKYSRRKEREIYRNAVLSCKSALSKFNPDRQDKRCEESVSEV